MGAFAKLMTNCRNEDTQVVQTANLGCLAAGAIEEILSERSPEGSPNLEIIANTLDGEPVYDPVVAYFHGHTEMREAALGYLRDIAFVDGVAYPL